MKKFRGYIFSRSFLGERVPQNIQNLFIRDFCLRNNFTFLLSATEYAMKNSSLMLFKILNELKSIDGVIMFSLRQLPENERDRTFVLNKFIEKKKILYFALENKSLKNKKDLIMIEEILSVIKITLSNKIDIEEFKKLL
ncbi:sporadic carbohydrate cluster protein, LIC12192 family [Alphaproteobacteria bacterium]|nr:sporadic carbohydrate cluster protein, LIC12192 family [Alphaproteobacteria bacterium]